MRTALFSLNYVWSLNFFERFACPDFCKFGVRVGCSRTGTSQTVVTVRASPHHFKITDRHSSHYSTSLDRCCLCVALFIPTITNKFLNQFKGVVILFQLVLTLDNTSGLGNGVKKSIK